MRDRTAQATANDADLAEIRSLTNDEHRRIAAAFLGSLDETTRSTLQRVLGAEGQPVNWPSWSRELASAAAGRYRMPWTLFRTEEILKIFRTRLMEIGIEVSQTGPFEQQLQKDRAKRFERKRTLSNDSVVKQNISQQTLGGGLKEFATRVIHRMEDSDIRKVWLPMGAVIDAFREHRP